MAHFHVDKELGSQPACWRTAVSRLHDARRALPRDGERVAVFGCGTSFFMAQAYAALREGAGKGLTDAFPASEMPADRSYDRYVAISRSGTTTEVLEAIGRLRRTTAITANAAHAAHAAHAAISAITAVPRSPIVDAAEAVVLEFADERSVVQTRFATTALALLRAALGDKVPDRDAERALAEPLADAWLAAEQVTYLGRGWTIGLAHEAALKARESARMWAESYPAMEYRHGPISIAQPGRLTWMFGPPPLGLAEEVAATGATFACGDLDPMAQLVLAQRLAVARAKERGLDPDRPRALARSVVLS